MLHYPQIDPVAFRVGPIQVHWYGLMYLLGFGMAWLLALYRAQQSFRPWSSQHVSDLVFYNAVGILVGGRVGYILFYDFSSFMANPLILFQIWHGGMSFHGGLIGVIVSLWLLSRHVDKGLLEVADFLVPLVPLGLAAGRLGNFINGELWGRVTMVPWAMVFPDAGPWPRHPSQLYECFLEGVLLFIIVWRFSNKLRPAGAVTGLFLLCYGLFRFIVEFFREPDSQLGFIALGWLTRGQELSLPMIIFGSLLLVWAYRQKER